MMGVVVAAAVGAMFGMEGRLDRAGAGAELVEHGPEHVVVEQTQPAVAQLQGDVAVTQVIGRAHQLEGAGAGDVQQRFRARADAHDAAILADTVRANLFAPGRSDEQLHAALGAVEMAERVAEAGGLDGWVGQETLSLGEAQRLNLARAFLSDKPLILLDEPTEHLDAAQGERILARLLAKLGDRLVVLSSHRVQAAAAAGQVLRL